MHAHREILSLDVRRANAVRIGITEDWGWDSLYNFTRGIPLFAFTGGRIDLDELGEIDIARQARIHGFDVRPKTIAR
jgi:hypothetical protein